MISRTWKTLLHSRITLYIRIKNDLKYFGPQLLNHFLYQKEWLKRSPCYLCTNGCKLFKLLTQLIDSEALWYETYAIRGYLQDRTFNFTKTRNNKTADARTWEKLVPFEDFGIHMAINFGKYSALFCYFCTINVWP